MPDSPTLRPAAADDAAALAAMLEAFAVEDGSAPGTFTTAKVLEHGFGPDPAFEAIIAWDGEETIGYALYFRCYNTEIAAPGLWMQDIWVAPGHRGGGVGRKLMAAVAGVACARGYATLWWGVRNANRRGRAFYAGLGAKDDDARILELEGEALAALAAEA